jgi:hypothetical protein
VENLCDPGMLTASATTMSLTSSLPVTLATGDKHMYRQPVPMTNLFLYSASVSWPQKTLAILLPLVGFFPERLFILRMSIAISEGPAKEGE